MPTSTSQSEPGKDLFLTHQPGTGRPFRLGGTAAYDACTVLPLSAVQEAGIEIDSYPLVRHDFVERDAPGDLSLAWKGIEGLTNCTWPGVDDQHIILQIYQPPFSHDWERTSRLDFLERKGPRRSRSGAWRRTPITPMRIPRSGRKPCSPRAIGPCC